MDENLADKLSDVFLEYANELNIHSMSICERRNRIVIEAYRRDRQNIRNMLYENIDGFNRNMVRFERPSEPWIPLAL